MWLSPTWMKEGGCASVVNATVFECRTRLSNKFCTSSFVFAKNKDVICKTQVKQTRPSIPKVYPTMWICKSPLGHCQLKRSTKQPGTQHAPLSHTREYVKRSAITSTIERHLFDCDKSTVKSKSIGLKYFVDAKLPTASPNLLYRRLSINPSWWSTMAIQLLCSCPKQDSSSTHVLPFFGLNENRVVPLAENFPMIAPPARGPCRQTPCRKAVCWQWGGSPLPVLRGSFWEA